MLINYLGGKFVAGGKMKEAGTAHWLSPHIGATNYSGWTALPGGYRYYDGTFSNIGEYGIWWSATESSAADAWNRGMGYGYSNVSRYSIGKYHGLSVRCVRD